jgi:hypothetical protein
MSVPFGPSQQGPFNEGHPELVLSSGHIDQIASRTNETASQLSTDIARSGLNSLIVHESRYSRDFCQLARQIGASAFPHPDKHKQTLRAEAIEYGMITGHILGRLLVRNGRTLPAIQLESAESLFDRFTSTDTWDDYAYWIRPRNGSLQEDASKLLRHRAVIPGNYIADSTAESLFYSTAGLFAANGLALYITKTTKLRSFADGIEIKATIRKIKEAKAGHIFPPQEL